MTHSEEYLRKYAQEQHEAQLALDAEAEEIRKIDRDEVGARLFAARAEQIAAYEAYSNTFDVPQNYGSEIDRLSAVARKPAAPAPAPVEEAPVEDEAPAADETAADVGTDEGEASADEEAAGA